MVRQAPSIFNDIVGPIMVGPSSSHTCAPSRIGYLCQQLVRGKLTKVTVEFAREGAYTNMYKGQRSDMGFVNGLLGNRPEDERLRKSFELAREQGVDISFVISDFPAIVPNISRMTLYSDENEKVEVYTDSTGGGTVKLLKIDGFDVEIVGDCYELIVRADGGQDECEAILADITALFQNDEGSSISCVDGKGLINLKQRTCCDDDILVQIVRMTNVTDVKVLQPILAVPSHRHAELPFRSAAEMLEKAEKEGKTLWELGIEYEAARSGWSNDKVIQYMQHVVEIMEFGVKEALKGDIDMHGIIKPTAGKIENYIKNDSHALDMGVMNKAVPWAMATMEYSSAMGVVLCAPTGGSAGVFPGAVLGTAEAIGLSMEEKIRAMFVTSIIGIVMSKDCNYSAELYGCQVEPGAASAMAAAGLVYILGGTPTQSAAAASAALSNILGTICDPVAGLVQVPCISRNALSAANAVISANMVMGGYDPLIPLDESAETLFRVGRQLPSELRCTCNGGLCITPCGQRLAREQEERDNRR